MEGAGNNEKQPPFLCDFRNMHLNELVLSKFQWHLYHLHIYISLSLRRGYFLIKCIF